MSVRIIRTGEGIVDGVSLRYLVQGCTYDLDSSVAHYLTMNGLAEDVADSSPALLVPLDEPYALEQLTKGVTVLPPGGIVMLEKRHRTSARRKASRTDRRRT
jgi:hypothetical protein